MMTELQILADDKLSKLDVSLYVAVFVFVVVIIPLLIVLAVIKNRKADLAEERAAEAERSGLADREDPTEGIIGAEAFTEEEVQEAVPSEDDA